MTEVKASGHLGNVNRWASLSCGSLSVLDGETVPGRVGVPGLTGHEAFGFDGGGDAEILVGAVELPSSYAQGTDIRPYIAWGGANSNAGNVRWQLAYSVANPGGELGAEVVVTVTAANPGLGSNSRANVKVSEFPVISGTNRKVGDVLSLRLIRDSGDAADTYASDALLFGLGLHLEVDGVGSDQVLIK
jgi:hypothetical protein